MFRLPEATWRDTAVPEAQQHLSSIEKNHVTEPSPRAERLDERIAADWRIT
jgi:hypothetical protein